MKKDLDLKSKNLSNPTRREREEIENFKKQIQSMKDETKQKE